MRRMECGEGCTPVISTSYSLGHFLPVIRILPDGWWYLGTDRKVRHCLEEDGS